MLCIATHCPGCATATNVVHQLCWGKWKIQDTPRFYLAAVEKIDFSPWLWDKVWEWPGNEARDCSLMQKGSQVTMTSTSISTRVPLHVVVLLVITITLCWWCLNTYLEFTWCCKITKSVTTLLDQLSTVLTNRPLAFLYKLVSLFHTNLHVHV